MSPFDTYFIAVFVVNACLGICVFLTNRKRTLNQNYLMASILIALWLTATWMILKAQSAAGAEILIRAATAIAVTLPASSLLLRSSILFPSDNWLKILYRAKFLLAACFGIALICFTPAFIKTVRMPSGAAQLIEIPEPIYGWGYYVFAVFLFSMIISMLFLFIGDRKKTSGLQRIELDFITTGYCAALATAALYGVVITVFTASSRTVPMANASSILAFTSIISYGIATKRILGIATILRRIAAYSILAVYLVAVYLLIWYVASLLLTKLRIDSPIPSQILATLAVAITMSPVHGKLQKVADKLTASKTLNISDALKKSGDIFQSVTTQNALLSHFSQLLLGTLRAEHIAILLSEELGFQQYYPMSNTEDSSQISHDTSVVDLVKKTKEPVCNDSLVRTRDTSTTRMAIRELSTHNANIAIGVFSKSNLAGIVLLGPRIDGRIYDKNEQDALQILCNQFAVALENAQMYTEMQDSKIRNEIMLDQLVSGVIVADPERKISLINNEAQRILGLTEEQALGQGLDLLPEPISKALGTTLATQKGLHSTNAVLPAQGEEEQYLHVRMGSAYLLGHDGKPMGALLVFTDMTEVKGLEEQVRRSDQLSSVGTLAAGMAHEIKNPLVTIKTFTQLLPERHDDPDFRKDFSSLVAHEVERIDGIVNQLLSFSKPSKPLLVPMKLHETIEKTLKLIHEQLSLKNIVLNNNLRAKHDLISGDADLLTQTLVNFNLNAVEAIGSDGTINVTSSNCTYRFAESDNPDNAIFKPCIRLQINDTGKGIAQDQLQKIFDPFFTSKSEGTGMGLSVAHGIIHEHHGVIEVDSILGKGTTFSIFIPILDEDATA